jgi:hypothetical protein
MRNPSPLVYWMLIGLAVIALAAPIVVGADGWLVPLIVFPILIAYAVFDRRLKAREDR